MNIKTLLFALAISVALLSSANAQATAQYVTTADWGSGFTGQITIVNYAAQPLSDWTFAYDFAGSMSSIYNAQFISHVGNRYTVRGTTTIPAGGSLSFGFTGAPGGITTANAPSNFTLNGLPVNNQPPTVLTMTTAFTYQGKLVDGANAANGAYDFEFALFDESGAQLGAAIVRRSINVTNGVFTASLDFGAEYFTGAKRFLEIRVKSAAATGAFTVLAPRQSINPVPYAIQAQTATNVSGGFVQLPLSGGAPPAAECNEVSEYGRQKVDAVANRLYICTTGGWKSVGLQ